ncbi:MAG: helix-turn-helix transcriptional regulator [Rhizobiales bacterium]|nr:helix-turn-helix transcriptional regulator [Hyphomicrobiales bacterium]
MHPVLGQIVLTNKANMSHDCGLRLRNHLAMGKTQPQTPADASTYKSDFIARVKEAREARGVTQEWLAERLGIEQDKYKQYETRSFLPHQYVEMFCLACGISETWLFTGKGDAPRKRQRAA